MTALLSPVADYLLNSLWQVPVVFAVAWLLACAARRVGPQAEHRVWVGALLVQAVLPACSLPLLATTLNQWWGQMFAGAADGNGRVAVTLGAAKPIGSDGLTLPWLHAALAVYACVTAYQCVRFIWQWLRLRTVRQDWQRVTLRDEDQSFFTACLRRWHIGALEIGASAQVQAPLTFGMLHPMLLLPVGFAETIPAPQMQATLGHELAHVRRNDWAKQMLYRLLCLPVAYHPLLWSTFARVAETREMVCDAMAADALGNRKQFARSLLELASLLIDSRPVPSHAIGMFDANRFERRIVMLHRKEVKATRKLRIAVVALSGVVALTTCASALALRLYVEAPAATLVEATDGAAVHVQANVMAGQIVSKVQPKYPEEAKRAKIQGAVILNAVIAKDGTIENLQVASGPEELRASALDAVKQWVYKPYLLNGEPTEVETTITVTYSMDDSPSTPQDAPQVRVQGVVSPQLVSHVDARYPEDARKAKIGGEVVVALKVNEHGAVSDVNALSGPPELRAAATDAVRQYVFQPATLQGRPVAVDMRVAVNFQIF